MRFTFSKPEGGPEKLVADAVLVFEDGEPLDGVTIPGFRIWRGVDGELCATLPTYRGVAGRYMDALHSGVSGSAEPLRRLKQAARQAWVNENLDEERRFNPYAEAK